MVSATARAKRIIYLIQGFSVPTTRQMACGVSRTADVTRNVTVIKDFSTEKMFNMAKSQIAAKGTTVKLRHRIVAWFACESGAVISAALSPMLGSTSFLGIQRI